MGSPEINAVERRAVKRVQTQAMVECLSGGRCQRATVYNLSTDGCMVEPPKGFLEPGDGILLHFSNRLTVEGQVAWRDGCQAGVRFLDKIHDLMVSALGFRDAKADLHAEIGRDRFGRPLPDAIGCKSLRRL
jgi:hypothetical protein